VQTTASTKYLDRADIPVSSSPEVWYQPNWQSDRNPVRERDLQYALLGVVHDGACPRLCSRCTSPGTGCPIEILPQLPIYPSSRRVWLTHWGTKRLGFLGRHTVPQLSQIRVRRVEEMCLSSCSEWWAVLGSNQWPLPCETEVGCLWINDMRAVPPIATRTCCHLISLDITQCHSRTVPKLSQRSFCRVSCLPHAGSNRGRAMCRSLCA